MPRIPSANLKEFKFALSALDKTYTVCGITQPVGHGFLAQLEYLFDAHKRDLASGTPEAALTTAIYPLEAEALKAAGAIALTVIDRTLSGHLRPVQDSEGPCSFCGAARPCSKIPLNMDALWGAGAIAIYVLGADTKENRRAVYNWRVASQLPIGRVGGVLFSRQSLLCRALNAQLFNPTLANDVTPEGGN